MEVALTGPYLHATSTTRVRARMTLRAIHTILVSGSLTAKSRRGARSC